MMVTRKYRVIYDQPQGFGLFRLMLCPMRFEVVLSDRFPEEAKLDARLRYGGDIEVISVEEV